MPASTATRSSVGTTSDYRQSLDLRTATITTSLDWTAPSGRVSTLTYAVNADQSHTHLGTTTLTVVPHWSGPATVTDLLDSFGFNTVDAGPLKEGWRIQRDTPGYGPRRTAEQLKADLAAAKRYRDM